MPEDIFGDNSALKADGATGSVSTPELRAGMIVWLIGFRFVFCHNLRTPSTSKMPRT